MPIQSRCPSCSAAVPSGAAWCSLCHADLRARREPVRASVSVDDVLPAPSAPGSGASTPSAPDPEPVGRREAGRHSREPEPVGRREASRRSTGRSSTLTTDTSVALEGIELPTGAVAPEKVEEIADLMLARLAITDTSPRIFDPSDAPGGKWAIALGGAALTIVLVLGLFTFVGLILGR